MKASTLKREVKSSTYIIFFFGEDPRANRIDSIEELANNVSKKEAEQAIKRRILEDSKKESDETISYEVFKSSGVGRKFDAARIVYQK